MKKFVLSVLSTLCAGVLSAIEVQSEPEPGKWCGDIAKCEAYSKLHGIPLMAFYGHTTCGHCVSLKAAMETVEFCDWAESRKIIMCYGMDDDPTYKFIKANGGNGLRLLPFVGVYWQKYDDAKSVKVAFTGMRSHMPVVSEEFTTAGCLIASVEKYIQGYTYIDPKSGPVAFAAVSQEMAESRNAFVYKKLSGTVPVSTTEGRLEGILDISISKKNAIAVKYTGTYGKRLSMKGSWSTIDMNTGDVVGRFSKDVGCSACGGTIVPCQIQLTLTKDGVLKAMVDAGSLARLEGPFAGSANLGDIGVGLGRTAVVLEEPSGSGFGNLTLEIRGTKVKAKGVTADGTAISATAALVADGDAFVVPVFTVSSKIVFGARLLLDRDSLQPLAGSTAYYISGIGEAACDYIVSGRELPDGTLEECCKDLGFGLNWKVKVGGETVGTVLVAGDKMSLAEKNMALTKIAYKKADGSFTGTVKLTTDEGDEVKASIKGVIAPDASASKRRLGVGTAFYKGRIDGKVKMVSQSVLIDGL